jgi:adenylyltransferase/sulfurtransferase
MGGGSGSAGALRHDRQTHLPEFGIDGQERLARARVLVVGAGGLGSPVALYLAAAGVGTLAIADDDHVELSNLHRQVLHDTCRIGQPKTESAAARIAALDPAVQVERLNVRLTESNAADIVPRYSIVVDCTDSIESRHAINRAALGSGVPWVYGAVHRWEGQVSTFARRAGTHHDTRSMASDLPCYRCLYPSRAQVDSCDGGGTVGSLCGIVGSVQATEALKLLLGVGEPLFGVLWTYDGLRARSASYRYARSETCPACAR